MHHTILISDVHLCEAVPDTGRWLRYRKKEYFPDADLAALFERMDQEARGGTLEVVFNGDLFDFDAAVVRAGRVEDEHPQHTEPVVIERLTRILDDHHVFVSALAKLVQHGHRLVFVSGNHDAQLAFPGAQETLRTRILSTVTEAANMHASPITFSTWFYRTQDNVHVEHGNQYDWLCTFRYPTDPFTKEGDAIQPNMGSLTFRHLVSRMGFFNPYVDSSFMLSMREYVAHWMRYYLFTSRSLCLTWIRGAMQTALAVIQSRTRPDPKRFERMIAAYAERSGISTELLRKHAALFARPTEDAIYRVIHELCLDRALLVGAGSAAMIAGALFYGSSAFAKTGIAVAASVTGYELMTPSNLSLQDVYNHITQQQQSIARIYGTRGVIFGHTHIPFGSWNDGVYIGNTGTWSPAFHDLDCTKPVASQKPVTWLRSDGANDIRGGLYLWKDDTLTKARA